MPVLLSENDPHVCEIKGYGVVFQEIAAEHTCQVKAECVFPRKRAVIEARDVLLCDFADRELLHSVRDYLQRAPAALPFARFRFIQMNASLLQCRFGQLHTGASQAAINEE